MTDRPDAPDDSESPEIAEVRRLLADVRHTEPMPDDVATRMDDVLAGLVPGKQVVVPLTRHRRRNVAGLLVAAAVVVGGVVVGPHLSLHSSSSPSGAAEDNAAAGSAVSPRTSGKVPRRTQGFKGSSTSAPLLQDGRVVVRSRHFSTDVGRARAQLARSPQILADGSASCAGAPTGSDTVAAEYHQAPAALVFRPVKGSSQVVDLYLCGDASPVRSTTLPAH